MSQTESRPVLLFAGQGCQETGMGRQAAEASREAMELWKLGERASGLALREIFWDGAGPDLSDTRALQPALTITHVNAWRMLAPHVRPLAAAGHSLGEFAALAAAGVISARAAVEISAERGRLMADADPEGRGAMAALVRMDEEGVERVLAEALQSGAGRIVMANYNSPAQHVVSGDAGAVEAACRLAKSRGGRGVRLKVSGAFHSPLMAGANRRLADTLDKFQWKDPLFPVFANVDGRPSSSGAQARRAIGEQMVSSVRWADTVRNIHEAGGRWWIEISPRAVLGKMLAETLPGPLADEAGPRIDLFNSPAQIADYARETAGS